MAVWQTTLTKVVRNIINDSDAADFSDDKIQESIVIAGLLAQQDFDFTTTYTFDLESTDISPDPAASSTFDSSAITLFCLRASCLLSANKYQNVIGDAIRVRDGDSEIDTTRNLQAQSEIFKVGPCKMYDDLLQKKRMDKSMNLGGAVMSPISHDDFERQPASSVLNVFRSLRNAH